MNQRLCEGRQLTQTSMNASSSSAAAAPSAAGSWSLLFSIPNLIMLSNLQQLLGARNARRPSIQPNEYMDSVIANTKLAMKERGVEYRQEHELLFRLNSE